LINSEIKDPLDTAIENLLLHKPDPFFIQIGGFDGVSFDPLRKHITTHNLCGLVVEPIPAYFQRLKELYVASPRVLPINCAISDEDGERKIWMFSPEAVEKGILPPHFAGISSFLMEDLLKPSGVLGRSSPNEETLLVLKSLLKSVMVPCRTLKGLLDDYQVETVDILQVDTEGYDFSVLKLFDFERYKPKIVHYEHQHLNSEDTNKAEAYLRGFGYKLVRKDYDTLAIRDEDAGFRATDELILKQLAEDLVTEGRVNEALAVLSVVASKPCSSTNIKKDFVRLLINDNRFIDAVKFISSADAAARHEFSTATEVQDAFHRIREAFNIAVSLNRFHQASFYAQLLHGALPENIEILYAILKCKIALGRVDSALPFADKLRALTKNFSDELKIIEDVYKHSGNDDRVIDCKVLCQMLKGRETF
jgi:FkbM family methyltransferase